MRDNNTVKHGIRLKRTKAHYFPAQRSVSTSGTAGVDTSTVMLLQYTKHTMLWLPSWLSVLPMLCIALSAAVYLNAAIMMAQRERRAGTDLWRWRGTLWWRLCSRTSWAAVCSNKTPSGSRAGSSQWSIPFHQVPPKPFELSLPLCWTKALLPISVLTFLLCCHPLSSLATVTL